MCLSFLRLAFLGTRARPGQARLDLFTRTFPYFPFLMY